MKDEIRPIDTDDKKWHSHAYQQWSSFFRPTNWTDFTFVRLEVEYAPYKGSAGVEVWLLGFGFTVEYTFDHSFTDRLRRQVDEIRSGKVNTVSETDLMDRLNREDRK